MTPDGTDDRKTPPLSEIRRLVKGILTELKEKGDSMLISRLVDYELKIKALSDENKRLKETGSTDETEKMKQELFQLQKHYRTLYDYYQRVTKENEELKAKVGDPIAVADRKKISELEESLKKLEEERNALQEKLQEKETIGVKNRDLEKKITELRRAFEQARQEAEAYRMKAEQTRRELLKLKETNEKLLKYKELVERAMRESKRSKETSEKNEMRKD